ncbi:MAG: hypothetical protein AAGF57_04645 [Pseudomonadota bacterium]
MNSEVIWVAVKGVQAIVVILSLWLLIVGDATDTSAVEHAGRLAAWGLASFLLIRFVHRKIDHLADAWRHGLGLDTEPADIVKRVLWAFLPVAIIGALAY